MFYPQSKKDFSIKNFKNPDKHYRAAPFWAWNTKLDKDELMRQIEIFKKMGCGGFHIHSRVGMATPYLSEEFFELVKDCNEKGKTEDLLTYLYDEDRWPSGSGGGFVTKNEKFRQVYLRFSTSTIENGRAKLLAVFDIKFNKDNTIEYKRINENDTEQHQKWYAYIDKEPVGNPWFNNQCYVDMMNPEAIAEFLKVTHEAYKSHLGSEFSKSIPSIFTDEPQLTRKNVFDNISDDFTVPWTTAFCDRYKEKYGEDIADKIPEIFFEKSGGEYSYSRYNFNELSTEMFAESFSDQYGKWCEENGIAMTGHIMSEETLIGQTLAVGDPLRHYLGFTLPGCDMLLNNHEFTTIKQANSVSRQRGREGLLCELDGVTNWDFDFRGHKLHGDWQAALGVTLRVPHLSWVSMNGEAKRDYPSTISYQAAWCNKYHLIEDYFARVNTILTRGKAECKVAVLHPVRNIWLTLGTRKDTAETVKKLDNEFLKLTEELVKNHVDFDFISESNFKKQNIHFENGKLVVDKCEYDILIIPPMLTLASSTVEVLKTVNENKGRVVAFDNSPKYMDAKKSIVPNELYKLFEVKPFSIENIIKTVDEYRDFEIIENNTRSKEYCGQLRNDGDDKWLFIAKAVDPDKTECKLHKITIKVKGEYIPTEFNCENGDIYKTDYSQEDGFTVINLNVFAQDSVMLKLGKKEEKNTTQKPIKTADFKNEIADEVEFSLTEENVFLIDKAQMKLDDGEFEPEQDILRQDNVFRKKLGIVQRGEGIPQPWVNLNQPKPGHKITLKCEFTSKIRYKNAILALENAKDCNIIFNNKKVDNTPVGWFVDKCINKVQLGTIKKGINTLIVEMPFGLTTDTENMYILGDFGVYDSKSPYIDKLPKKLKFGDISSQGLLFYGGNVDYHLTELNADKIYIPSYKGGLIEVLDGNNSLGEIIYSPYTFDIKGKTDITLRLYGTRINTFGQLHLVEHDHYNWYGPFSWRTSGNSWTDDYLPWEQGILKTPLAD